MPFHPHHEPTSGTPVAFLCGFGFALFLFLAMAFAQMMGTVQPPSATLEETLIVFQAPEVEELPEEEPPPPEEEEELRLEEEEVPDLSLDQLDIALNVGSGGSLAGEFSMAGFGAAALSTGNDLGNDEFVDFLELDRMPRPIGVTGFDFPRHLRRQKVRGRIVLLIKLDEKGQVLDVQLDSSDLPAFDDFVLSEVRRWRFTPPTRQGRPVKARARLPIPIRIS
jgi:protein TonB